MINWKFFSIMKQFLMKKPILKFSVFYNLILYTKKNYCEINLETKCYKKDWITFIIIIIKSFLFFYFFIFLFVRRYCGMRVHVCIPSFLPCSYLLTMTSFIVPNRVEAAAKKDNAPNKRKKEKRKLNFFLKLVAS